MSLWKEFKAFMMRGNVLDLAVGLIIGSAFSAIISSLVDDIIMPPIGLLLGRVDFSELFINLSGQQYESLAQAQEAGAATINYGIFCGLFIGPPGQPDEEIRPTHATLDQNLSALFHDNTHQSDPLPELHNAS
jgi:hypothetical protein